MPKPKVRGIAAFIRIERESWELKLARTLEKLRAARQIVEARGYPVESLRITTQPFPQWLAGADEAEALALLRRMDDLAVATPFELSIGPAMSRDADDPAPARLLARALESARLLQANLLTADARGPFPRAMRAAAEVVHQAAANSPRSQGPFNFTALACVRPNSPFFPGSWHDGPGGEFAIGLESAGVVAEVLRDAATDTPRARHELASALSVHAAAMAEAGEEITRATGWRYLGFDPTPAPLHDVSIGAAIEGFTGARFGAPGTLAACALVTSVVQAMPVRQVGYSGLMLPVLEDARLAQRWSEGLLCLDALLAYSAVCATGLDTIPLPGNVTTAQLELIYGDVAALAVRWGKPLAARLMPVAGKGPGDMTDFSDPFLTNARLQPLPQ
jgi:uncharacterized protein (UPF0210 family)